ncbi:MAG: TonB-dependent receptor [Bryobacteraceae bacterium]
MTKLLIALTMLCGLAYGQSDRGTVTGTVADPSGAVVGSVPINLRSPETGVNYSVASSATGNYTIAQVPAGVYRLEVVAPGFKRFNQENIRVQVGQTARVDVTLEVGSNTESITITDEVSLLKTEDGALSHTIAAQKLNDLPVLGIGGNFSSSQGLRFYMAQATLIPGTFFQVSATGTATIKVNGAPTATQRTQIDGMDATNTLNGVPASMQPSVDSIQETTILVSDYAAEFGQVGGGIFNITLKSGTNRLHGSGYDYLQNEALNANTPFTNAKGRVRRNDYGFSVGAPILIPKVYNGKDKSFFFWNFEQYREFGRVNNLPITVPLPSYRAGDFSSILTARNVSNTAFPHPLGTVVREGTIFDPLTSTVAPNGQVYRTPFLNNTIPLARMDPVALKIQNLIPAATSSATINNLTPNFPTDRLTKNYSLKLDHQMSRNGKLSFSFGTNQTAAQYSTNLNLSEGLPPVITQTRGTFTRSYTYRFNYDHTLSPSVLLHLGAGIVNYPFNDNSPTRDFDQVKELGLTGAPVNPGRFPSINGLNSGTFGGMVNMGAGVGGTQSTNRQVIPTFNTSLTWVKNNHTIKAGGELRLDGWMYHALTATMGVYAFSAAQTGQPYTLSAAPGGVNIGFPYASFLLGQPNQLTTRPPADYRFGKKQWGFFLQDNWKVTRKLTLDYGLRYDYSVTPREQYGRLPSLAPTLPNAFAGGHQGATAFEATCNCVFAKNYPLGFGPRIGAAYQLTGRTVLRGGFGLVYGSTGNPQSVAGGINQASVAQNPQFGVAALQWKDGIPVNFTTPFPNLNPSQYPTTLSPTQGTPYVIDQNGGRPSRQTQWSVGVQHEVFRNMVVDVSYVGNRGVWWNSGNLVDYNAPTRQMLQAYGLDPTKESDHAILISRLDGASAQQFRNKFPYAGFPGSSTVAQSLRVFPQFSSGLAPIYAPLGQTWYNSLQAKVTKRYSSGLDFSYAFTYSQELQNGTGGSIYDVYNRGINKSLSTLSRPLVSVFSANYTTQRWAANKVVSQLTGGWMLGAVVQYASGTPIAAPASNNQLANAVFQTANMTRVAGQPLYLKDLDCHCIDPNKDLTLNPAAWTDATRGNWGQTAIYFNDYRSQRIPSESMSLARIFAIKEGINLSIRGEFSNIFNRTFLNGPSSTNPAAATTCILNSGASASGAACGDRSTLKNLTAGFGFINPSSVPVPGPRSGTIVARLTF